MHGYRIMWQSTSSLWDKKKNDSSTPKSHQLLITPHLVLGIPYLLLIPYCDFVGLDLILVYGIKSQFLSVYTYNCLIVCVLMSYCRLIDVLVNPSTALAFVVFLPPSSVMSPEHWKKSLWYKCPIWRSTLNSPLLCALWPVPNPSVNCQLL